MKYKLVLIRYFIPPPRPWDKDRFMAPDIDVATKLLQDQKVKQIFLFEKATLPFLWYLLVTGSSLSCNITGLF